MSCSEHTDVQNPACTTMPATDGPGPEALAKLQLPLGYDLAGIYTHVGQRRVKNGKAWTKVPS